VNKLSCPPSEATFETIPIGPPLLCRRAAVCAPLWAGLAGSWLVALHADAAVPAGKVDALRGEAFALATSRRRTLTQQGDVFVGDMVATGANSFLALRLGAATLVRLGADAQLRIDRFLVDAGGVLDLARGAMVFDRDEAAPKTDVSVRSPYGLIAVRGTRFFAGPSNGVFGVFVERGEVTVVGVRTAVRVRAGLGTDTATPGSEPTDPHPWGAARIQRAFADVG
jgi:hypothetical protein